MIQEVLALGNESGIMPRSVQASRLRKSLLTCGVTYTICLVVFFECVSVSCMIVAPRMWMLSSLAACILRDQVACGQAELLEYVGAG